MLSTSRRFLAGHRLRVTITGADADNAEALREPPATIRIRRAESWLDLPVEGAR